MDIVKMTHSATQRVLSLMHMEGDMSLMLRAYITGGGCHGFQYGFSFEEQAAEDDTTIVAENIAHVTNGGMDPDAESDEEDDGGEGSQGALSGVVTLLIDPISLQYLRGAEIDFVHDATGERFVIKNPNAKVTCGCARSFAV